MRCAAHEHGRHEGTGILYFKAADATSGVARVTLTLRDSRGRVVKSILQRAGNWAYSPERPYYWLRFRCDLAPGRYRLEVRGRDRAGNPQVTVGRNWLRLVRSGSPRSSTGHTGHKACRMSPMASAFDRTSRSCRAIVRCFEASSCRPRGHTGSAGLQR